MQVVAELKITMTDTGSVSVTGPIENQILAYGLLQIAKDTVKKFNDDASRRIQPASAAERLAIVGGKVGG